MKSIFDDTKNKLYRTYNVELTFPPEQRLAGSIPDNPVALWELAVNKVMRAHGLTREQMEREMVARHEEIARAARFYMEETGHPEDALDEVDIVAMAKERMTVTNIFRRDETGIWFASHSVKASFKENMNILFAGERFGGTGKGGISFIAERVFIDPSRLYLYRDGEIVKHADGVQVRHGTVPNVRTGGMTAIITQHEYVNGPTLRFKLRVLDVKVEVPGMSGGLSPAEELEERWPMIMTSMERNGLGSQRKQSGYGCFFTTKFDRIADSGGLAVTKTSAKKEKVSPIKKVVSAG